MAENPNGAGASGHGAPERLFRVSDPDHVAAHLNAKDQTGMTLYQMGFLGKVEHWVLNRLAEKDEELADDVTMRLQRLDDIVANFRNKIPADNPAFLQILSWLTIEQAMYTVEYLQGYQDEFFMQLVDYCRLNEFNDVNADLALKRIRALNKTRLLDRWFSKANVDFVVTTLTGIQ
ncbi:hypothetical protein LA345_36900 (plasmid) [Burkholderia vietnamiensis]|uniref:Uncharacterized protein n=1 Tax=Burkholderia vietnamiensis (strain G4 / LMG 22486) TaxID=269482 RepID=A4JVA3_BURVG|nr:hypothetical protein Bcep1808_7329 [Burkholderia vietnamiensis G4]MCB4349393.1 hypothetical protein [Burkholderia vietnamiensis]